MNEDKKQPEETPEQMTAREYIDATLQPGENIDEERAKQYKMIAMCAALTSIASAIRTTKNDGDERIVKAPLRDNERQIMNELEKHFKLINAIPPYIDPNDSRSIKLLTLQMWDVVPFIMDELKQTKEELPLKGDIDLYAALALGFRDAADPIARPFVEAVERARKRNNAQQITYKKIKDIIIPTDKLYFIFWTLLAPPPQYNDDGKRRLRTLRYESPDNQTQVTLGYDFTFNSEYLRKLGIEERFTEYDCFVGLVLDNLFRSGNAHVSIAKIASELGILKGHKSRPSKSQYKKLLNSLIKGSSTPLDLYKQEVMENFGKAKPDEMDPESDIELTDTTDIIIGENTDKGTDGRNKPKIIHSTVFKIKIEANPFIVNGKIGETMITIYDYSEFYTLANDIDRVSPWVPQLLRLYKGRRTDRYWAVMHYLIRHIGWMNSGTRSNKISFSEVYKYTGDESNGNKNPRDEEKSTREMITRLLDEVFVPAGVIKNYKVDNGSNPGVKLNPVKRKNARNNGETGEK